MNLEHSEDFYLRQLFESIKIREVMSSPAITLFVKARLSEAHQLFKVHTLSHLLIVDADGTLLGLLSPKYLYKTLSPRKIVSQDLEYFSNTIVDGDSYFSKEALDSYILSTIMKKSPYTLTQEDSLGKAIVDMDKKHLACIPIVDKNKKVQGVLTNQEIINYIARILSE